MKLLFSLLTIFMLNKECEQPKTSDDAISTVNTETSKEMQENMIITYEANTRGFYEKIWISKDSTSFTNDRNGIEKVSRSTSTKEWSELMTIINSVAISDIPKLEAPTSKRFYDGAAIANLTVTTPKEEIKSNSFDHGEPPKEIEALVNKVISIKEKLEED